MSSPPQAKSPSITTYPSVTLCYLPQSTRVAQFYLKPERTCVAIMWPVPGGVPITSSEGCVSPDVSGHRTSHHLQC